MFFLKEVWSPQSISRKKGIPPFNSGIFFYVFSKVLQTNNFVRWSLITTESPKGSQGDERTGEKCDGRGRTVSCILWSSALLWILSGLAQDVVERAKSRVSSISGTGPLLLWRTFSSTCTDALSNSIYTTRNQSSESSLMFNIPENRPWKVQCKVVLSHGEKGSLANNMKV